MSEWSVMSDRSGDAVKQFSPRNADQHGGRDPVAEKVTDRLGVLPDGTFLRLNPPEQPTVADVVEPGTLIKTNYVEWPRKVFQIREREIYGINTYTVVLGHPDDPVREDGYPKNYSGANIKELVYQDGLIQKLFLSNQDSVEPVGHDSLDVDYQASLGTFSNGGVVN